MSKILIVDDEQINLDFFEVMLSKLGFEVVKASDGEEALDAVRDSVPDLIVLDNIMPKLSGWEVTKILKQDDEYRDYAHIPIIMFSAMDDVKDKIEGFELGIEDYITKPFNFSEVLARIKAVLRNRELSQLVVQRERRIALVESLNKSLVYFTRHLKEPMLEIQRAADSVTHDDADSVSSFIAMVKKDMESTLATLEGLEEEIQDLTRQGNQIRENEVTLDDLEAKYQKHIRSARENAEILDDARP
ncbi:MAG: response regulator [Spirochaetales bacterium]|nr:MAG: response regulator [Spirochaetales bacterium]